jgi:pimeloyl-ACP methyl ester carboxylesterase
MNAPDSIPLTEGLIRWQGHSLNYKKYGAGPEIILAFHGFGFDATTFAPLAEVLPGFTLYSFDLFFHGTSRWASRETPMYKSDWKAMMEEFLSQESIERFGVMGYSLGGKFALATFEAFPSRIQRLWLMAADGIRTHPFYSLATYPVWLRKFFRSMVSRPNRFFFLTSIADKLRLVNHGILRFAESQMNTRSKRARVYYSWVVFRLLKFDMEELAQLINVHRPELKVFTGKYDRIITTRNMQKLLKHLPGETVTELPTGHNQLLGFVVKYFHTHKVEPLKGEGKEF